MTQLNLQSTSLEFIESGAGQPVVLVHGSASDYRTWDRQFKFLVTRYRVVNYSRRFHWPNQPAAADSDYAMNEQVEDLEQLIRSLNIKSTHIIGHSYGAYLALMVAIRYPDLVDSLVLAEPPVIPLFTSFPPRLHEILALLVSRPGTALPIIRFAATGAGPAASAAGRGNVHAAMAHFGKAVLGAHSFNRLSPERLQQAQINSSKAEFLSKSFMTGLDEKDVRSIRSRTLLVTGEKSPVMFHRLMDRLEELLPNSERVDIPGASHIMHEDNAAYFNHMVLAFLESQRDEDGQ